MNVTGQMDHIVLSRLAKKQLSDLPKQIVDKFSIWRYQVETEGLNTVRRVPGWHDEPLKGKLKGLRSVRLNRAYRVIYSTDNSGAVRLVEVREVNKHDYKI